MADVYNPDEVYNPELLNCPFCGFKAVICKRQYNGNDYRFRIQCDCAGCACRTPWLCYLDDAAKVWNRRADDGNAD